MHIDVATGAPPIAAGSTWIMDRDVERSDAKRLRIDRRFECPRPS